MDKKKWYLKGTRSNLIVQSNELIEACYNLELNEQRLILFMASQIRKGDSDFRVLRIPVKDFAEAFELDHNHIYGDLKKTTKSLTEKSITFYDKENKKNYSHVSWLASATYVNGILELEFSEKLKPYLLDVKGNFSKFSIGEFVKFKGMYSIRLYQMFKQYEKIGYRYYTVEEFRKVLGLDDKYPRYSNLKNKVIAPALTEINKFSNLRIEIDEKKEGKKVVGLYFGIKKVQVVANEQKSEEPKPEDNSKVLEDYQVKVVKDMLKGIGEISDKEVRCILNEAKGDINKVFEQYMIVLQSNGSIRNVVGFMIDGIRNGYQPINLKKEAERKNWNYSTESSVDEDFDMMAKMTRF